MRILQNIQSLSITLYLSNILQATIAILVQIQQYIILLTINRKKYIILKKKY